MLRIRKPRTIIGAVFATTLVIALAPITQASAGTTSSSSTPYYSALGDSLSQGVQPNSSGQSVETTQGYVDDLYSLYRHEVPGLQLAKLGCPGETTGTMRTGGICSYSPGSQLNQAVAFLETHHVVLVTIDIGANNVDGYLSAAGIDEACIANGITAASTDLPVILGTLQAVAHVYDPGVRIVGMNYYDPFLAELLQGAAGQALATASVSLATYYNGILGSIYGYFHDPVADVQSAFLTTNFTPVPIIGLPANVVAVCALTWMCAAPPVGPNIHARPLGYGLIAFAFEQQVGDL